MIVVNVGDKVQAEDAGGKELFKESGRAIATQGREGTRYMGYIKFLVTICPKNDLIFSSAMSSLAVF
jgi:hypothetical protein